MNLAQLSAAKPGSTLETASTNTSQILLINISNETLAQ
jgi:hypothetical protein